MGRGFEQTFFQRKHIGGEQTHENMFNITYHQGNANLNHNEILNNTCQSGKRQQIATINKDAEKREAS